MGRLVSMTESGIDMLSFVLDSVAFRPADLLLLMMIIVMNNREIRITGIITPSMIGVLSWSVKGIKLIVSILGKNQ